MRKLLPVLLIFSGCAMRAQQSFPGVNITPNGGAAGKVQLRTSANANSMFLQDSAITSTAPIVLTGVSSSVSAPALTVTDTGSGYLGRFFAAGFGGWDFTTVTFAGHTGSWPGTTNLLMSNATGDIGTSGQMAFYESAGLAGDGIVVRAPSGGVSSGGYTINLPGAGPSVAGQALSWVSGSTYSWQAFMANPLTTTGDIIYSSSGTTAARLGIGTAGQCLVVTAGVPAWGSCSSGASPFIDTTAILYSAATPANTWTVTLAGLTAPRVATPPDEAFTMAGINITQTFSADQTLGANLLFSANNVRDIGSASGATRIGARNIYASTIIESPKFRMTYVSAGSVLDYFDWQPYGGIGVMGFFDSSSNGLLTYDALGPYWGMRGTLYPAASATYDLSTSSYKWRNLYLSSLSGSGTRCVQTDTNGLLALAAAACVTSVTGTSPIVSSGGTTPAISCSTCVTTAGGQSISGTTTLSTLVVNTAATINAALTINGGNVDIDTGQTYAVAGAYFGQDLTNGFTITLAGGGTCTLYVKSGIVYASIYSGGGGCDTH